MDRGAGVDRSDRVDDSTERQQMKGYYLFICGLFDRDRYSVHRQTENNYPMQVS